MTFSNNNFIALLFLKSVHETTKTKLIANFVNHNLCNSLNFRRLLLVIFSSQQSSEIHADVTL